MSRIAFTANGCIGEALEMFKVVLPQLIYCCFTSLASHFNVNVGVSQNTPEGINQATAILAHLEIVFQCWKVWLLATLVARITGEGPENVSFSLIDIGI